MLSLECFENKKLPEHSFVLQISVISFEPVHSFPPFVALIFGTRIFVRVPEPHSLEQSPMFQISHLQSTEIKNVYVQDLKMIEQKI